MYMRTTIEQVLVVRRTIERAPIIRVLVTIAGLVTFVLVVLALAAGKNPGYMEDYHILSLNTSTLGQNLIPTPTSGGSDPSPTSCGPLGGALGKLCASATGAVGTAVSSGLADLSGIEDDIVDKLSKKLGIQQWYSFHVMNICDGTFTPNATSAMVGYSVTSCTQPLQTSLLNISALLDHQLDIGPLHLNLADIGFPEDLQNELDKISKPLQALAVLYTSAVISSGLSLFLGICWLLRPTSGFWTSLANIVVAVLALVLLWIGNLIVMVSRQSADKINSLGQHIGLSVSTGGKFVNIIWTAFALMVLIAIYWGYEFRKDMNARQNASRARRSAR